MSTQTTTIRHDAAPTRSVPSLAEPWTTVGLDGRPIGVRCALRGRPGDEPPVVTVTPEPVSLTVDDVAAMLVAFNLEPAEVADDDTVRWVVAEAVLNLGCLQLDTDRVDLINAWATVAPGSAEHAWLEYCRQRAAEVFTPAGGAPRAVPGPRSDLAD